MNSSKRSHTIPKITNVRYNGKLLLSTNKQKSEVKVIEWDINKVPLVKDTAKVVPKYNSIVEKSGDDGILMDDLDQLQQDLEKLLSTSALRIRYLLGEIGDLDKHDDIHEKKGHEKTSDKRKRPDDKTKFKELRNGLRSNKKHCTLPVNKYISEYEVPKVTLPRNVYCDRFWASIQPYCANVTKHDINVLDNFIQEFSKEYNIKIPELGEHYASDWTQEILKTEINLGKSPTKKNFDLKKSNLQHVVDSFSIPQTQRLLSALIEEQTLAKLPKFGENGTKKLKFSDNSKSKTSTSPKLGSCLDARLRKELVDQGILTFDDLAKCTPEDEILAEIKKFQQELAIVNRYNVEELTKLKAIVTSDYQMNTLKEHLDKVDRQILMLFNKLAEARKLAQKEGTTVPEPTMKEFEIKSDNLLKQQSKINREIMDRKLI